MRRKLGTKTLSLCMALALAFTTSVGVPSITAKAEQSSETEENILKLEMDETGYLTPTAESQEMLEDLENQKFSWDNATVYFVLTDRFKNSDTSNDHSYGRGMQADGKTPVEGLDTYTNPGTFHGGDIGGLTEKVKDGYFTDLGVNAIWITAPYEQIHGYTSANVQSNNANIYPDPSKQGFPYYSYHGYWTLDYTQMDANMGTEKEFEEFVDSCHERGIRVVMDVVMNHVGYTTMQDAVDYDFSEVLMNDWQSYYYGNATYLMGGDPESSNYWNKESAAWATKWWGPGFVRASYPGYTAAGGDDYHTSLSGLPDVVTESTAAEVSTPPLLVNKWKKEGRYEQEQKELDTFFAAGHAKQPRYYIIKWLTDWVREYGVDGFRCDTAKHVDKDAWKDLKTEADKALKEWRQNNPDKPGAQWTDNFWMTGEAWGHGMGKSEYFTQGGFDSMINFAFNKSGDVTGMEETYSSYADAINSDPEFNVLSYLSSHDDSDSTGGVWSASDDKNKDLGTCLLLSPGGVQIYYGNEVNRGMGWTDFITGSDYKDQRFRTDMDWNNINTAVLTHWNKVGQFRNKHLSVGAGQHQKLDGEVYTFSRTYHLEEEDEDKVVVALPGKKGTFNVNVGDIFEEGETVTDYYSGETYVVSGGAVSASCDDNGVILLEGSGVVKPSVNAKAKNGDGYKTDELDITLKANKVTDTYYSINDGTKKAYNANDIIAIGGDTAYGEKTTLKVEGKSEVDGSVIEKTFTYIRSEEPVVTDGIRVEASKEDFPTAPNIFVYTADEAETALNGAWPGAVMEDDGDCWVYTNDEEEGSVRIILSLGATSNSGGTWRSTADKVPGLLVSGGAAYTKDSTELTEIPVGVPGRVNINYVDTNGKVLKSIYRVGAVGKTYKTYESEIEGYTLTETPENATGTFETESTVTYVYKANGSILPVEKEFNVVTTETQFVYDGTAKELLVAVKDGNKTLKEGSDYKVTYANNINACTDMTSADAPVVIVTGIGDYADVEPVRTTFGISPKELNADGVTVSVGAEEYTYNGEEYKPTVEVRDSNATITKNDYEISYADNKNAGTAKLTVTGKGNYTGKIEKEFTINKAEIPANAPMDMVVSADVTKLSDVELKNNWKWENQDTEVKLNESLDATAYYDGADKDNYKKVSVTVKVTKTDCKHEAGTEVKGKVEATCATDGYTGDVCCSICGAVITSGEIVKATGKHSGGTATCTKKAECKDCHSEYGEIDATNHTGGTEIRDAVEATCKQEGYTGDTYCKDCGKKIANGESIPKAEHKWDAGKITKEPTTIEEGERTYTCTVCGETKTEVIGVLVDNRTTSTTEDRTTGTTEKPTEGTTEKPTEGTTEKPTEGTTEKPTEGTTEKPSTGTTEKPSTDTTEAEQKKVVYTTTKKNTVKKGTTVKDSGTKTIFRVTNKTAFSKAVEYVSSNSKKDVVLVPDKVVINGDTYKVTSVSDSAFKDNETIKAVVIGKNVKKIGKNAFVGCKNLEEVELPNSITTINDKAFYQCTKLKSITISSKVSKIGKQAFYGCKNLKKITIKTKKLTNKKIGSNAFKGISSKATVKVPKNKVKSYKKLLKAKGLNSKVTVKKIN